jgi:glutathione synthase
MTSRSLTIAVQMDHISGISIAGDSTFAMLLEAQARGHTLLHYTPDRLAMRGTDVYATVEPLQVRDEPGNYYTLGTAERINLKTADVVLMRQDPPFDMAYITATHILEQLQPEVLVVNDPAGVRNAPEKILVMQFADLMPPTLITKSDKEIKTFRNEHGDIVIKPLYGNGGKAVFRLREQDQNMGSLLDLFSDTFREPYVIQKYLPEIRKGDKRILLVDGEYAGAVNRIPADDDLRSNMVRGGRAEASELTKREEEICNRLGPVLRDRGFLFTGIDVIGDYLTEINVTSPTGIRAVKRLGGPDVASLILDSIEAKIHKT